MVGPSLIFDKSALESLNLDEAVLLDNFYTSNITPIFFVECLADLEKHIASRSTPEQLVGSLAERTPECQSFANVHHADILKGELSGQFDLSNVFERPVVAHGTPVQLDDQKGMLYQQSMEEEALERWIRHEFYEVERHAAKQWRRALTMVDFGALVRATMPELGHWRKPRDLEEAKRITETIVDYLDPAWLIEVGLIMVGVPEARNYVLNTWISKRRPPLREHLPYFVFILSIDIFFCLVLQTQLLSKVKASHQIDLAYLYYLPFCSVFTSKDNFHVKVAPLFMTPHQTFVHATDLKEDLKNLDELYSSLPEEVRFGGLMTFAKHPPDDQLFLTTRLWDKYLPRWRLMMGQPDPLTEDEQLQEALLDHLKRLTDSQKAVAHDEHDLDKLSYVSVKRPVRVRKGKWQRFSQEIEQKERERRGRRSVSE